MKYSFRHGDEAVALDVEILADGALRVRLPDGTEHTIRARRLLSGDIEVEADGERVFRTPFARAGRSGVALAWDGATYELAPYTGGRAGKSDATKTSGVRTAPMVGVVAAVHVAPGDRVDAYQPLVVIEAMKVLATVEAPFAGTVCAVHVRKGDRVEHGASLVEIAPEGEEATT